MVIDQIYACILKSPMYKKYTRDAVAFSKPHFNRHPLRMMAKYPTVSYLWPDRVLYPNHTDGCEVVEDAGLIVPGGLGITGEVAVRHADGPKAFARHGFDHLLDHLVLVPRAEDPGLTHLVQDMAAPVIQRVLQFCTWILSKWLNMEPQININ